MLWVRLQVSQGRWPEKPHQSKTPRGSSDVHLCWVWQSFQASVPNLQRPQRGKKKEQRNENDCLRKQVWLWGQMGLRSKEALQQVKMRPKECSDSQSQVRRLPKNLFDGVEDEKAQKISFWREAAQMFRVQRNIHRQLGFEEAPRRQCLQHPLVKREAEKTDLNNK